MGTAQYPCLCALIRKVGRVVTRRYDAYLQPSGLKATQYCMLTNIAGNPAVTVSDLAELLVMDQTTVSRNLRVLDRAGYINLESEVTDHRIKRVWITDFGATRIKEARPLWEEAQSDMERVLGKQGIEEMTGNLGRMIE